MPVATEINRKGFNLETNEAGIKRRRAGEQPPEPPKWLRRRQGGGGGSQRWAPLPRTPHTVKPGPENCTEPRRQERRSARICQPIDDWSKASFRSKRRQARSSEDQSDGKEKCEA